MVMRGKSRMLASINTGMARRVAKGEVPPTR